MGSPHKGSVMQKDFSMIWCHHDHIGGLVQDCSNSIANALELLQPCTEPLIYNAHHNNAHLNDAHRNNALQIMHTN